MFEEERWGFGATWSRLRLGAATLTGQRSGGEVFGGAPGTHPSCLTLSGEWAVCERGWNRERCRQQAPSRGEEAMPADQVRPEPLLPARVRRSPLRRSVSAASYICIMFFGRYLFSSAGPCELRSLGPAGSANQSAPRCICEQPRDRRKSDIV